MPLFSSLNPFKRQRVVKPPTLAAPTVVTAPTTAQPQPKYPPHVPTLSTPHPTLFAATLRLVHDLHWLRARIGRTGLTTWRTFDEKAIQHVMHRRYVYECEQLHDVPNVPLGWCAHSFARYCTMLPPPPCAWQRGLSSDELRRYVTGAYTLENIYKMRVLTKNRL